MTVTTLPTAQAHAAAPVAVPRYLPPAVAVDGQPTVFAAINTAMRGIAPVRKDKVNEQQRYKFRGIDDVMSACAGPFREAGVFILPEVADQQIERRGEKMTVVRLTMRYSIFGPAGDCLVAEVPGEAFDFADKATNKAQSAALKYLLFTVFMIPVDGRSIDDGDRDHPEPAGEQGQQRAKSQARRGRTATPPATDRDTSQQSRPSRDYVAEARAAESAAQVRALYDAAKADGAPREYLATLADIGGSKPFANARQQKPSATQTATQTEEQAHAAAENALRIAASRAQLNTLDADFERAYGLPIGESPVFQLDAFRQQIERALAGGAQ